MDLNLLLARLGFWFAWLLIPLLFECIPALSHFAHLLGKKPATSVAQLQNDHFPYITVIIPVFNSQATLFSCLASLANSNYDKKRLQVIVVNNQSQDDSFSEFARAQKTFSKLNLRWLESDKGKANALNAAIYTAKGQYIINIDSDGTLDKNALLNIIATFEADPNLAALTGTILIDKKLLKQTKRASLRLLQLNEYFEYIQAFLTGRQIETLKNQLFTLSGAFSAFRKNSLCQTKLYDPYTVGEDAQMTFQIRENLKQKVGSCANAIFYTGPISSLDALYQQRQRWQRGEIETAQAFMSENATLKDIFSNFMIRKMLLDHTFIFFRLIWLFGLGALIYLGYSVKLLLVSLLLLYLLYIFNAGLSFLTAIWSLTNFPKEKKFLLQHAFVLLTLPLYNLLCALIRLLAIINSLIHPASWTTVSLRQELQQIKAIIKHDINSKRK